MIGDQVHDLSIDALAAGSGISTATAWRYVREAVTLLAARAPRLRDALKAAAKAGRTGGRRG